MWTNLDLGMLKRSIMVAYSNLINEILTKTVEIKNTCIGMLHSYIWIIIQFRT